jgi:hypothetical protein
MTDIRKSQFCHERKILLEEHQAKDEITAYIFKQKIRNKRKKGRNSSGSGQENREYDRGIRCADHAPPSIRKSWYYFAKKRRSFGRHSSLADQSNGEREREREIKGGRPM